MKAGQGRILILDARAGRLKPLADSLDFQYMRTVFNLSDANEDGFVFLSDAFIRQLVGPASKIKEKRRLEALTSLAMLTHGAMFTAWETGQLPADHKALLSAARLRPEWVYAPEGKSVAWDAERQVAVSDAYNTLHWRKAAIIGRTAATLVRASEAICQSRTVSSSIAAVIVQPRPR